MRYSIFVFLICCYLFSCVYANTNKHTITQVVLHDDIESSIITNKEFLENKDHVALILEFKIMPQLKDSTNFNKPLLIQETINNSHLNTQNKYIILKDFSIYKEQRITTPLGVIKLKQDSTKHAYMEFSSDTIRSAMLILYDKKVYLIFFDTAISNTETISTKNSSIKNLLDENKYDISSWRYFVVLGIMIAILVLLYVIKLRQNRGIETSNIILEQTKILDSKNKIALIRYGEKRYLIGVNPQGITLLDSMQCATKTDINDIESNLQNKQNSSQQSFTQLLSNISATRTSKEKFSTKR